MPTISGVTTHDGSDVVGLWTIAPVPQNTSVEDLPFNLEGPWSVYAPGHGIGGAIDLEPTSGDLLYWAEFISNDRTLTLGPYPFTLTGDRTWDDIIANPAPLPAGGGGGGVILDGPTLAFEINDGATIPLAGGTLEIDTLPNGYTLNNELEIVGFEPGWYHYSSEIDFSTLPEDRLLKFTVNAPGGEVVGRTGSLPVNATASGNLGNCAFPGGTFRVREGETVFISMAGATAQSGGSTDDWEISYLGLYVTQIG